MTQAWAGGKEDGGGSRKGRGIEKGGRGEERERDEWKSDNEKQWVGLKKLSVGE